MSGNVTRCINYLSIFGHLEQWKFASKYKIFAKVGSRFCKLQKVIQEMAKLFLNFAQVAKFRQICSHWCPVSDSANTQYLLLPNETTIESSFLH